MTEQNWDDSKKGKHQTICMRSQKQGTGIERRITRRRFRQHTDHRYTKHTCHLSCGSFVLRRLPFLQLRKRTAMGESFFFEKVMSKSLSVR
jgi:hypothetical protein